jgi:hypothetical protein
MAELILTPFVEVPEGQSGSSIEQFTSAIPSELVTTLAAPTYTLSSPRNFRRVAHVAIPNCNPGDIIFAAGCLGMTTEISDVEFCSSLIITPDATGTAGIVDVPGNQFAIGLGEQPTSGIFLSNFNGENISIAQHHARYDHAGAATVPSEWGNDITVYAAIIVYAASRVPPYNQSVVIDNYSTRVTAIVARN